jgi:hypothetical protein
MPIAATILDNNNSYEMHSIRTAAGGELLVEYLKDGAYTGNFTGSGAKGITTAACITYNKN